MTGWSASAGADTERHRYEPTEIPMYRLAQQPPHPLDRVQDPASHADGQQGRDEG